VSLIGLKRATMKVPSTSSRSGFDGTVAGAALLRLRAMTAPIRQLATPENAMRFGPPPDPLALATTM
jgi:hypothetical protein